MTSGTYIGSVFCEDCDKELGIMVNNIGSDSFIINMDSPHSPHYFCIECAGMRLAKYGPIDAKMKAFMEIYDICFGRERKDLEEQWLISELQNSGKFTEDEARTYLRKAMQHGLIYERKAGSYAKA